MALHYFKKFVKLNLSDGSTYEDSWTADEPLKIKRIYLKRGDGAAFTDSLFYFKIVGTIYTHPDVPAAILGPDKELSPVLDIPFPKGAKLDFSFKNTEGAAVDVYVVFEVEKG